MLTELTLPYADTRAAALHWSPRHPESPPLGTLRLGRGDVRLALHLLGASHSASLAAADAGLVETVACPEHGAAGEPVPARRERVVDGLHYRFTSRVETLPRADLTALATRLRAGCEGRDDRLAGVFPGDRDALTVLTGAAAPRGARWRTWHIYPGTGEVVRTATEVTW